MKKAWLVLSLCALVGLVAVPPASAHDGRDPEDNFEVEGHVGFYWNWHFPTDVDENPAYTTFLNTNISPALQPFFRPEIRSENFRWHWGMRVSFDATPRWSLEYSFDMSQSDNFRFDSDYIDTVVPTALATVPTLSIRRLREDAGRILVHHANLVFNSRESGRLVPYLTGGLSVITYGEGPLIDAFESSTGTAIVFGYEHRHTKVGGNLGAGVKYYAGRHVGVRLDGRFLLAPSRFTQRGAIISGLGTFGPDVTQTQRGLYSNFFLSFGIFGRF